MLKQGDKVKIVKKILTWNTKKGTNSWVYLMDSYLNKIVTIDECDDEFSIIELGENLYFPIECCIKINKIQTKLK